MRLITIDGPAGSGKSSVARRVAQALGWSYVTTGAIYRTLALVSLEKYSKQEKDIFANIPASVELLAKSYRQDSASGSVYLDNRDISVAIRHPEVSVWASILAERAEVRQLLFSLQRKTVFQCHGAVVDGRDMGTVVFPEAPFKFFLTASPEERARRRSLDLSDTAQKPTLEEMVREIHERDQRDSSRAIAPLKPAEDAVVIDSTKMSLNEVIQEILKTVKLKRLFV